MHLQSRSMTSKSTRFEKLCVLLLLIIRASGDNAAQTITWTYANDLARGASFLGDILKAEEVVGLVQVEKCRIFRTTFGYSTFIGVCNTRDAPRCSAGSDGDAVATTFTFLFPNRSSVDKFHETLVPFNDTRIILGQPNASPEFGAYAFNFYDADFRNALGCYRFEAQSFDDPAWPSSTDSLETRLRDQLKRAGSELQEAASPKHPISCECADFCSGRCFAPSCVSCAPSAWTDESTCLDAGPLGEGLLCAQNHSGTNGDAFPCCSPTGDACSLVGGAWCDCKSYPAEPPLFPPLTDRTWDPSSGLCSSSA